MTSGEFMFKIHLSRYVILFGLKSDEMTELIISISFPLSGCITTEEAEHENRCDLLLVLQVLSLFWNICWNQIATCIRCFNFRCHRSCSCVFWVVVSLFNVKTRLYLLFWAAKIDMYFRLLKIDLHFRLLKFDMYFGP